jgi:hypothetical protein
MSTIYCLLSKIPKERINSFYRKCLRMIYHLFQCPTADLHEVFRLPPKGMYSIHSERSTQHTHGNPGQPERSVYGSKRIKNGYFTLTRYFSYMEIHLRPSSGWITDCSYRLPSTICGSVTNTVYGPFYTVLIKFLFDNSIHCTKYLFLLISILCIQIIHLFIYNDVDDLFNSGIPHVVFLLWKPSVKHRWPAVEI